MSTNPNNALGTNGAFGGRTSVDAFNDVLATFSEGGVLSGFVAVATGGLTIALGGTPGLRDVAIATDPNGNKTTINNISGAPVSVSLEAASTTGNRLDSIVAYVNSPATVSTTDLDNPGAVGIIAVSGSVAASPTAPDEATIRAAITADGGTGSTAYYVELAQVFVSVGSTDILQPYIAQLNYAVLGETHIGSYDNLPTESGPNVFHLGALTVCFGTSTASAPSDKNEFSTGTGIWRHKYDLNQSFGYTFNSRPTLLYTIQGPEWKFAGDANWTVSQFTYIDVLRNDNTTKNITVRWIAFGY